jgi:protein-disulfide isomerase
MHKGWFFLAVGLLVGFGIGFGFGSDANPDAALVSLAVNSNASGVRAASRTPFDITGRPAVGPDDAPVEFVEFTDYECPFCKRFFEETYPEIRAEYKDRVKFVVRNFPLRSIHADAQKAAEAAECAFDQGQFWRYHDHLFRNSENLGEDDLRRYARDLGLDGRQFDTCLDSGAKVDIVQRDVKDGYRFGVSGTPAFFINGQVLVGAQPADVVRAFIDMALEDAGVDPAATAAVN